MSQNFRHFSKNKIPCPVCSGQKAGCRQSLSTGLIFCREETQDHPHYHFRGSDKNQVFYLYAEKSIDEKGVKERQAKVKIEKKELDEKVDFNRILRHQAMKSLINQCKKNDFPEWAQINLIERGLTPELVDKYGLYYLQKGTESQSETPLPGFTADGKYGGKSGILIPITDVSGSIIGAQVRTNESEGKYRFLSETTVNGRIYNNRNEKGEIPLTVIKNDPRVIGFCEGYLKPILASKEHGWTMIGTLSNNFVSSPETLKATLEALDPEATLVYCPDYKGRSNRLIHSKTKDLIKLLHSWGREIYILDWGQLYKNGEKPFDIDELDLSEHNYFAYSGENYLKAKNRKDLEIKLPVLLRDQFKKLLPNNIIKQLNLNIKPRRDLQVNVKSEYVEGIPYNPETFKEDLVNGEKTIALTQGTWQERKDCILSAKENGYKVVLDNSFTGSGKSLVNDHITIYDYYKVVGESEADIEAHNATHKLALCMSRPRNPTTPGVEENFHLMPSRHSGLHKVPGMKTPCGNDVLQRATKSDHVVAVPGNCQFSNAFKALSDKKIEGVNICGICPLKKLCQMPPEEARKAAPNETRSYGYLYQKRLAMTKSMLRMHPNSLSQSMTQEGKKCVIHVDEPKQSLDMIKRDLLTFSSKTSIVNAIVAMKDYVLLKNIQPLFDLFFDKHKAISPGKYGLNYEEFKKKLPKLNARTYNLLLDHARKFRDFCCNEYFNRMLMGEKDFKMNMLFSPSILIDFIEGLWGDRPDLTFTYKRACVEIMSVNQYLRNCLNAAEFAVYQDATMTRDELATLLGISKDEILEIHNRKPTVDNLEIEIVYGLGGVGKERTENTEEKLESFLSTITSTYGVQNVGIIDHVGKRTGCLHHHSSAIGSNEYREKDALVMIDVPMPNLNAKLTELELLLNQKLSPNSDVFTQFYHSEVRTAVIQEIGRLRANRRLDQKLKVFIVSEHKLPFLADEGYKVRYVPILRYNEQLASAKQRNLLAILKTCVTLTKQGYKKITQQHIMNVVDITQSAMSKLVGGFKTFIKTYQEAIEEIQNYLDDKEYCLKVLKDKFGEEFAEIMSVANFDIPGYFQDYENGDMTEEQFMTEVTMYREVYKDYWDYILSFLPIKVRSFLLYDILKRTEPNIRLAIINHTAEIRDKLREYQRFDF